MDKTPVKPIKKRFDTPVRIIVVNCQSFRNKKHELGNIVESTQPDIVIGTESWLHKDIQSSEVFPNDHNCFRKDRKDSYGGVFVIVSNKYIYTELPELII